MERGAYRGRGGRAGGDDGGGGRGRSGGDGGGGRRGGYRGRGGRQQYGGRSDQTDGRFSDRDGDRFSGRGTGNQSQYQDLSEPRSSGRGGGGGQQYADRRDQFHGHQNQPEPKFSGPSHAHGDGGGDGVSRGGWGPNRGTGHTTPPASAGPSHASHGDGGGNGVTRGVWGPNRGTGYAAGPSHASHVDGGGNGVTRGGWGPNRGTGHAAPPASVGPSHASHGDGGGNGVTRGGWGPNRGGHTAPPASAGVSESVIGPLVSSMRKCNISQDLPSLSADRTSNRIVPIVRPDGGGKSAIQMIRLRVNHFLVKYDPEMTINQYDVEVKAQESDKKHPVKITKSDLAMIRNKLCSNYPSEFPLLYTAYDGVKNIYSLISLPTGKFEVNVGEDGRRGPFIVSINLVSVVKLSKLNDYLNGGVSSIPRDALQGLDLVMKENPSREMLPVGKSFHPIELRRQDIIGRGIIASRGAQYSLKLTSQGLAMCLDYSVLALRKKIPVIDFLHEHIRGFNLKNFNQFRGQVYDCLKGLKVTVHHRRTKQKYIIAGLTRENTVNLSFSLDDPEGKLPPQQVSLLSYFEERYQKIMHKDIPCLDLGRNNKTNYVPMEFCILLEGQVYPKEKLDKNEAAMLKNMSLAKPTEREAIISEMIRAIEGPCGGDIASNFGMKVDMNMTSLVGRVLAPPELKLGSLNGKPIKVQVDKDKRHWNFVRKALVDGRPIQRWAVLDFSSTDRYNRFNDRYFIPKLIDRCRDLGICMEDPLVYEVTEMKTFYNVDMLHDLLQKITKKAYEKDKSPLQFILCVMSNKDPGYKHLKWISETRVGVMTQCCLSGNANKANDQYLANLVLKINAKLGGSNVELFDRLPNFKSEDNVMFFGADVNHPSARNTTCPSIAAVVATLNWPALSRYAARVQPQQHRKEDIVNFGEICLELVETYARMNKRRPNKIIIFRDGVSEGQFDMVLNEELVGLKTSFKKINYSPSITVIVAAKRHQTRFFPEEKAMGNILPGTVIDTKVVHPFEFDFYLCSHYGTLGTSKSTHYHVLWDENGFMSDDLQRLIYNLCFTFARCTKPVSLVPPVYYADLVAYRGRLYYEAMIEGQSPISTSSSFSSHASSSSASCLGDKFYKLHADLENVMFFV